MFINGLSILNDKFLLFLYDSIFTPNEISVIHILKILYDYFCTQIHRSRKHIVQIDYGVIV